ncbi:hypothetical protein HC891_24115 [Candidatus Gracilibacteria bacterium]|nr:hypothetical protein [Candidatus Gracilibacteria bacterium]
MLWALLLIVLLRLILPTLAQRVGVALPNYAAGGLALLSAVAFAMRYGGRLYPHAMHGDIGWHTNRFNEALWGTVYILSRNRGIDFAYPPGPYLLVAPFTLVGVEVPMLLQFGAALLDALSAVLIYVLATKAARPAVGLLAAAIYTLTAATFMTTWWSFDTHIYSQFLLLLALTSVVLASERWQGAVSQPKRRWILVSGMALLLVFVGHFGFFINTALLGALALAAALVPLVRGVKGARNLLIPAALAYSGALILAIGFFYSAYVPLLLAQAQTAASGGLTELADKEPIGRDLLWRNLWQAGFVAHYGLFPVLLAPMGTWLLVRQARSERNLAAAVICALMLATFVVSALFAAMPFITQVNSSTRWLMFAGWAIAVASALAIDRLWRWSWINKLAVGAMALFVLGNTAYYWLGPMLWRIRPPEPF